MQHLSRKCLTVPIPFSEGTVDMVGTCAKGRMEIAT